MKKILFLCAMFVLFLSPKSMAASDVDNMDKGFLKMVGTIEEVNGTSDFVKVSFNEDESETPWILLVEKTKLIIDGDSGKRLDISSLKAGKEISIFFRKNTPVLQSYPGQFSPNVIFINGSTDGYAIDVDYFDEKGHGIENRLQINEHENVRVFDNMGKELKDKSLYNNDLAVLFKAATRSIPPITSPEIVYVIPEVEEITYEIKAFGNTIDFTTEPIEKDGMTLYPVREIFEKLGYTVDWDQETFEITLTLNDEKLKINTKDKIFYKDSKEINLKDLVILDGRTYGSEDLFK